MFNYKNVFYYLKRLQYLKKNFSENGNVFVKPKPVYVSQFADTKKLKKFRELIDDKKAARKFGVNDINKFTYWAWRCCGIASVQMVLKTKIKNFDETLYDLVNLGLKYSGYDIKNDFGWYHNSLCKILKKYGLFAKIRKYVSHEEICYLISLNNYVISSIKSSNEGHLILIFGYKIQNSKASGFWYHDPSTYNKIGKSQYMTIFEFNKITKRSIIECH